LEFQQITFFMARADLQVHSMFSDRPSEWLLRRVGVPQSYTKPENLYQAARAAGMDFVTVTDHHRIEAGLALEGNPGVFLSEEVTTFFSDGVRVHLLVWGLNREQHEVIQDVRRHLPELVAYLRDQKLAHGVAHPLSSVDGRLTVQHVEQLLLWFKVFEGLNGLRVPQVNDLMREIVASLTREKIEEMSARHGIVPLDSEPWKKVLTGGSDDHGGMGIARAWTETPRRGGTWQEFLEDVMAGNCQPGGLPGNPQLLASGLYSTAFQFAQDRLSRRAPRAADLLGKMFERFLAGQNPVAFSFGERVHLVAEAVRSGQIFSILNPSASLPRDLAEFFNQPALKKRIQAVIESGATVERRSFVLASEITNYLGFRFFKQTIRQVERGDFLGSLQSASALLPVAASVAPYFVAFHAMLGNRKSLEEVADRVVGRRPDFLQNRKRAWLTDTLEDVNGVARTIRTMTAAVRKLGGDLTIVTSRGSVEQDGVPVMNFTPVGEFELPEYQLQKLSFPPILEMLDYIQREGFSELIISTPGPVGIVGLIAAKMFGLRVSGIYHTDFPQYVRILSDDSMLESLTWNYMQWFYAQMDVIYSNTRYYKDLWIRRGIPAEKVHILPRGLDTDLFHPRRREENFWVRRGAKARPLLLYVGRVSKEKDLDLLPEIAAGLERRGCDVSWAIVGEGPYREELQARMPRAIFTGVLTGQELGAAYASADLFVFPSTTDTYGNVVVEACSAGLPVVVSDVGGPAELVRSGVPGWICRQRNAEAFVKAIVASCDLPRPIVRPDLAALSGWEAAARKFWDGPECG
jgi:glycosyltransferase involved in cell wall biosynthesis